MTELSAKFVLNSTNETENMTSVEEVMALICERKRATPELNHLIVQILVLTVMIQRTERVTQQR